MKAKFEITKTVEVALPHYRKNNFYYYKILSDKCYCIAVGVLTEGVTLFAKVEYEKLPLTLVFGDNTTECTAEEFNDAYYNAICLINSKDV